MTWPDAAARKLPVTETERTRQWGLTWVILALALGLHVVDEALTDFLPLYNSIAESLQQTWPWTPLPTFSFAAWLAGLVVGVLLTLNALGHIGASLFLGYPAPRVYSSPV